MRPQRGGENNESEGHPGLFRGVLYPAPFLSTVLWTTICLLLLGCGRTIPPLKQPLSLKELRTDQLVTQNYEYTCGAAALATSMNLLGEKSYTEKDVLKLLKGTYVRQKGEIPALSVAHLIRAAKQQGFKVVAFKSYRGRLSARAIRMLQPMIVRLKIEHTYEHFVVVRGVEAGWVYISDPAYGNFRLPWSDFYHFWDEGGRVFVTISKKRFLAWKTKQGVLHIKRDDSERISVPPAIGLYPLYHSAMRSISVLNSIR